MTAQANVPHTMSVDIPIEAAYRRTRVPPVDDAHGAV